MDFRAVWVKPELGPEQFMFPYVEAEVHLWDQTKNETVAGSLRTIGSHEPSDVLANVFKKLVNLAMRGAVERPLYIALMVILDSEDYKQAHDEWRRWLSSQPKPMHDNLRRQACGILS